MKIRIFVLLHRYRQRHMLMNVIKSEEDIKHLQQNLEAIYKWADANNMNFNSSKFEVIRYGPNQNLKELPYTSWTKILNENSTLKDLGIWMSKDCTLREHVTKISKVGRQMLGWILLTFLTRNPDDLLPLWRSLVVSRMEYSCQLWCTQKRRKLKN